MVRTALIAAAALALAGRAAAQTPAPPPSQPAPVAARAHLVYRQDPHARPVDARLTVLEPQRQGQDQAQSEDGERPANLPQMQITIVQINRT